jgi:hypothetical protein
MEWPQALSLSSIDRRLDEGMNACGVTCPLGVLVPWWFKSFRNRDFSGQIP